VHYHYVSRCILEPILCCPAGKTICHKSGLQGIILRSVGIAICRNRCVANFNHCRKPARKCGCSVNESGDSDGHTERRLECTETEFPPEEFSMTFLKVHETLFKCLIFNFCPHLFT